MVRRKRHQDKKQNERDVDLLANVHGQLVNGVPSVRRKIVGVGERRLGHDCELLVYRNEESIPNDDYDKDRARDYIRPSRLAIWSETTGITLFYVW
jgi:hypothetical protein